MFARVKVLCEGQTEERFITDILQPYFQSQNIYLQPIVIETSRGLKKKRGGIGNYKQIKEQLQILCKDKDAYITTMIDYYGLPSETPGCHVSNQPSLYERVKFIEQAVENDLRADNLKVYLSLHEFESLLFSDLSKFSLIANPRQCKALVKIVDDFCNPEHINNSYDTAPSRRLKNVLPEYAKNLDGITLAKEIGLHAMLNSCPHFKEWIDTISTSARVSKR